MSPFVAWLLLTQLDTPPPPHHRAIAEQRAAWAETRWWADELRWRCEGEQGPLFFRSFSHEGMLRLQRCIRMEVEP